MSGQASVLDRLRQPEYTGENRCIPCTVVNIVIAAVTSALLVLVSLPAAAIVFVLSLAAIYLRGYLVPGTPALTKQYLPASVLRMFDKGPETTTEQPTFETLEKLQHEREKAVDPDQFLLDIDAIELREDGEEYYLTDAFASEFDSHVDRAKADGTTHDALAEIFGVDPAEVESLDRDYPAINVDGRIRKWPSQAALVTDIATHMALSGRSDRWMDVPVEQRGRMLESLRGFQTACVECGGAIELREDIVESCCGQHEVKTFACTDCGQHLLEFDQARVGDDLSVKGMTP